jgi:hypothetical protein
VTPFPGTTVNPHNLDQLQLDNHLIIENGEVCLMSQKRAQKVLARSQRKEVNRLMSLGQRLLPGAHPGFRLMMADEA